MIDWIKLIIRNQSIEPNGLSLINFRHLINYKSLQDLISRGKSRSSKVSFWQSPILVFVCFKDGSYNLLVFFSDYFELRQ